MKTKRIVAINQYGDSLVLPGVHPRKELMDAYGVRTAQKMYIDRKGESVHCGYIVLGLWFMFYKLSEWEGK